MHRIGRVALSAVCVGVALMLVVPHVLVRIEYVALSPGDRVTTVFDGFGDVESVEGRTVRIRTEQGEVRDVPASEVTEL